MEVFTLGAKVSRRLSTNFASRKGAKRKEIELPRCLPWCRTHASSKSRRDGTIRSPQRKLWGAGRANDKPQRGGTLTSPHVPPRRGLSVSFHASPQLPLWATFVSSLRDFPERRAGGWFMLEFKGPLRLSYSGSTHAWLWPCRRSTRFHSKAHCGNEPGSVNT